MIKRNMYKVLLIIFVIAITCFSTVSDATWSAVINKQVTIVMDDLQEITATILSFQDSTVTIIKKDGSVTSIDREKINLIRMNPGKKAIGDFFHYNRAFRFHPAFVVSAYYDLGYEMYFGFQKKVKESVFELGIAPRLFYFLDIVEDAGTRISIDDSEYFVDRFNETFTQFTLQLSLLISHRPAMKKDFTNTSLIFNFWNYGITIDWLVYDKNVLDLYFKKNISENSWLMDNTSVGLIYKPSIGFQLPNKMIFSLEPSLIWTTMPFGDVGYPPVPVFSVGLGFTFILE